MQLCTKGKKTPQISSAEICYCLIVNLKTFCFIVCAEMSFLILDKFIS